MVRRLSRKDLGPKFSEGTRLLWLALIKRKWDQARACEYTGISSGTFSQILWGERGAGLAMAMVLRRKMRIPLEAWYQEPTEPFEAPESLPVEAA